LLVGNLEKKNELKANLLSVVGLGSAVLESALLDGGRRGDSDSGEKSESEELHYD
jgi:hypothetical protein